MDKDHQLSMQEVKLRKGPWLQEEDELLEAAVNVLGERRWDSLAKTSGLRRSGKSCRLRWLNYLRPNLKHGGITDEEERVIIELHEKWGNKWARIAQRLPGRTDNEIKNYWKSYLKKKALALEKDGFNRFRSTYGGASLSSECDTASPRSINDGCLSFEDTDSGSRGHSSDGLEQLSLTSSPYETRMTEWMSNCFSDTSKRNLEDEVLNGDMYDSKWISDSCGSSIWDFSFWDRNALH